MNNARAHRHPRHRLGKMRRRFLGLAAAGAVGMLLSACSESATPEADASASALTVTRPAAPAGDLPAELQTELQAALDQTMAEYDVPGAAVGVWIHGEGQWTTAAGLADIANAAPASTDMTFPLRSITKSYTVTLILQLVDEGMLSLDDTIDEYVDGVTNGDKITLRQLADMSSGNADYTNEKFIAAFMQNPAKIFTLDELNSFMLGEPAQFAPGEQKVYTNANTNLLGAVVEEVTGQQFADVLEERILQPLGQDDTRYILDVTTWADPHPVGYTPEEGGGHAAQEENFSIFGPAGSMITSLDDARVWGEVLATGALLEPDTQAERQKGKPLDEGPPYDIYALGIGETDGWWGHNGEGLGFTAAVFHDPDSGATVAVFMNESNVEPKAHPADQLFRRITALL